MSCTHLVAFLHLYCIHIVRMHPFSNACMLSASSRCWTPAMVVPNVRCHCCQRPTLAVGQIWFLKMLTLFYSLISMFYRSWHLLQPLCMQPNPCFGFTPRSCIVFHALHRFPCLASFSAFRTVFCARFGFSPCMSFALSGFPRSFVLSPASALGL